MNDSDKKEYKFKGIDTDGMAIYHYEPKEVLTIIRIPAKPLSPPEPISDELKNFKL